MKFSIKAIETVESTQDAVKQYANKDEPEGFVIHALEQSNGRGRQGKKWYSPKGNLYFSVLLRPDCLADDAGQLAFVLALAVSAALDNYLPADNLKTLKWPNDIMVNSKKIAGILIETSLVRGRVDYVIAGVGINISCPPDNATCLDEANQRSNSLEGLRDAVLDNLARQYKLWQTRGFEAVRKAWIRQAHGLDQSIVASLPDSEVKGVFKGIDEQGWLVMEDRSGNERHIKSGQILFK